MHNMVAKNCDSIMIVLEYKSLSRSGNDAGKVYAMDRF